jgi:enoyl-CoA hydratase/carnithine racemase
VLAASGPSFCAGADFSTEDGGERDPSVFYAQAMRLFDCSKPVVAAVHGAAIGAGLGLALAADFRVTCREARLSANFTRLGIHPGFGISVTLPLLIGQQQAALMLYTGRRLCGDEAMVIGLADILAPQAEVRQRAMSLAADIAESAPLAVQSTRKTLRTDLAQAVRKTNQRELALQREQFATQDFREGVAAMAARRAPVFTGA